jgi:hypothetical protein
MLKIGMTFNGKKITSSTQLKREFEKAARQALGEKIRRSAPPGVRVSPTGRGFKLEGQQEKVERTLKKLERD